VERREHLPATPPRPMSKSDLGILNAAAGEITQEACIRNVTADYEAQAAIEQAEADAAAAAMERKVGVEMDDDDFFDDLENDPALASLQEKRLAEIKNRYAQEKQNHMQGHGEYREIVEEEFLKEVCGSENVVVHFYHNEFLRCKIIDKHMRVIAPKHKNCKFLHLNAEKAPFFVHKLCIQVLPTLVIFKDGVSNERLTGFEELGHKDEFRTEVLEHCLAKAGCIKLKRWEINAFNARGNDDSDDDDGSDEE